MMKLDLVLTWKEIKEVKGSGLERGWVEARERQDWGMKMTLIQWGQECMELYFHSPIDFHGLII
jgi:hypothetical protein